MQAQTNATKRARAAVVVVKKESSNRWAALSRKVDQLTNDAAKITEAKTVASLQKIMAKVAEDVKQAQNLVNEVSNDASGKPVIGKVAQVFHADRSTIVKPVEFVHKFLDKNPGLGRKEAIDALSDKGVNFSTARTQYQKWFKAHHA